MKTILKFTVLVAALAILPVSCKKYLDDVATNPNYPEVATPASLLANIQVATFNNFGGHGARRVAIFLQQMGGTDGQLIQVADYQVLEGDVTNEWEAIFNNVVVNCNLMERDFGDDSPYYRGISRIFKAMNLGLATSMWGDIPFDEAGRGFDDIMNPQFEDQEQVYRKLQELLSSAIDDLNASPGENSYFPSGDFLFGGDPESWKKIAWLLKARYANHLSKRDPSGSATLALQYLNNAGLSSSSEDANAVFGTNGNELNQWYAFENERGGYMKMGRFFVDTLSQLDDPRLPFYATTDNNGGYSGTLPDPDSANLDASRIGPYYGSAASPSPLATYVEALFIRAEANLRLGNPDAAAEAYNMAVKESLLKITGSSDSDYESRHADESGGTITLQKIMFQKYIAMFTQIETWADWRRTGVPQLKPNPGGSVSDIPRILPTSQDERLYNRNARVVTNLLQRVWWDVQ